MTSKRQVALPASDERTPSSRRRRSVWIIGGSIAASLLVIVMYQPTPSSLVDTLPGNLGDPALGTWILAWESHALVDDPNAFFAGNIFYPYGEAIKYSEIMLPVVPVFGVVAAISDNPMLAHNLAVLGLALFCLATTYLLSSRLVGPICAVVAAVSFSFSGYVFMHQGHLQLLTLGFFPLAFLALFRALEKRRLRDGVWLGVCSALLTTASFYYGAIWFVCLFVVLLVDLIRLRRPDKEWWYMLLGASVVTAVTVGPIAVVYAEFKSRIPFAREVGGWGLNPIDFLTPAPGSLLYGGLFNWASARQSTGIGEHGFFLGFVVMALSLIGLFLLVSTWTRSPSRLGQDRRHYEMGLLGLAGAVSLIIALGPEAKGVAMPFRLLADFVPGSRKSVPFLGWLSLPSSPRPCSQPGGSIASHPRRGQANAWSSSPW